MPSAQCLEWNTVGSQGMLLLPSPEFQETKRMAGNPSQAEKARERDEESRGNLEGSSCWEHLSRDPDARPLWMLPNLLITQYDHFCDPKVQQTVTCPPIPALSCGYNTPFSFFKGIC